LREAQLARAAEHREHQTRINVLEPASLRHLLPPRATLPMKVLLTACIDFNLPFTLPPQDDALARLETFLTSPYLIEIAGPFPEGRV
jgi:hypothetical protein